MYQHNLILPLYFSNIRDWLVKISNILIEVLPFYFPNIRTFITCSFTVLQPLYIFSWLPLN
jgi:hypothetical protein